jgi:DHA2 family multidrug resistance protein
VSNRFLLTFALMACTIMQVLDSTITNVALPHMAGELGATSDSISWVLTSYMVGSSLFMPMTGFLTDTFGRRKYLLICVAGFVATSALCGIAGSLGQIVLFRLLQGVFGAALVPLSQAIMVETYPPAERGKAMAVWGMGVMVAPIVGPALGGWLTETFSWRWTFYINIPVGALSLWLAANYVPNTETRKRKMDWLGFGALALAMVAFQVFIDRGNEDDWFSSNFIAGCAVLALVAGAVFLWHQLTTRGERLMNLSLFKNRNFAMACAAMFVLGIPMYGGQLLQPQFLESWLGFPAADAGLYGLPRGVASFLVMMAVSRLMKVFSAKTLVGVGIVLSVIGSVAMTRMNAQIPGTWMALPLALQGAGLGLIFVPMSSLAFSTIAQGASEAAGIYSLVRTIGSSIGISLVSTYFARSSQHYWGDLRGYFSLYRPATQAFLNGMHLSQNSPAGVLVLGQTLSQQAQLAAYVDTFWLLSLCFAVMLPLVLLMRNAKGGEVHASAMAE